MKKVQLSWAYSYETILFDTPDGDLGFDQFTVRNEKEWIIREHPKDNGNVVVTTNPEAIKGKKEVKIKDMRGAHYDVYELPGGRKLRVRTTREEYQALALMPGGRPKSLTQAQIDKIVNNVGGAKIAHVRKSKESRLGSVVSESKRGKFTRRRFSKGHQALVDDETGDVIMGTPEVNRPYFRKFVGEASGRILIGGLGLALLPLALKDKKEITEVIIVEKYPEILELVADEIKQLPKHFHVVVGDIFGYTPEGKFDHIFLDTWNNIDEYAYKMILKLRKKYTPALAEGGKLSLWGEEEAKIKYGSSV